MSGRSVALTKAQLAAVAFERRVKNSAKENGALFAADGDLIVDAVGTERELEFPAWALRRAVGATMTHNHPRGTGPSLQDLVCGIQWKLLEVRVVAGDYTYMVDGLTV